MYLPEKWNCWTTGCFYFPRMRQATPIALQTSTCSFLHLITKENRVIATKLGSPRGPFYDGKIEEQMSRRNLENHWGRDLWAVAAQTHQGLSPCLPVWSWKTVSLIWRRELCPAVLAWEMLRTELIRLLCFQKPKQTHLKSQRTWKVYKAVRYVPVVLTCKCPHGK